MINTLQRAEGCRDGLLRFYVSMALGRRGLPLTYDRRREVSQIARWSRWSRGKGMSPRRVEEEAFI